MQLRSLFLSVALCAAAGGCGPKASEADEPESWMQGWFSLRHHSDNVTETFDSQIHLHDDGSAVFRDVLDCGRHELTLDMQWEAVDGSPSGSQVRTIQAGEERDLCSS